ncbi:MAG: aminodeoxychorismate synthase component I [Gammaproteobacteria bacterium]|nr:aminodeoxychorismate synthase component I [Gammaproteobacteria bacterium]
MNQVAANPDRKGCGWRSRTLRHSPDLSALQAHLPQRYPCLLESVAHGTPQARYDILFAFPQASIELDGDGHCTVGGEVSEDSFLESLDRQWRQTHTVVDHPAELPFSGGWVLYLGYELVAEIEPRLSLPKGSNPFPVACALRVPAAIIWDHQRKQTHVIAETDQAHLLNEMESDITDVQGVKSKEIQLGLAAWEEDEPQRFLDGVGRIKAYIEAGDVFQVNLSRAWRTTLSDGITAAEVYGHLRRTNPAPFAGLFHLNDEQAIISSSPERLVSIRHGQVSTRPIAGTYPRGVNATDDRYLAEQLVAHPKERAEHVMLIDLERNDLGRVCEPGSIQVDEFMVVEHYRHVHHIVSQVSGRLREGWTPIEVIRATFPGGTITGCPKVRCMEIISELEQIQRGAYTGAMGYLNRDGSMDLNILIRTLVKEGKELSLRAGAGIVADSVAERELAETRAKAEGLLRIFDRIRAH